MNEGDEEKKIGAICAQLRAKLKDAVDRNKAEGMLFSGGLDTSVLAFLSPDIPALSVRLEDYGDDYEYAKSLSSRLKLSLHLKEVRTDEALEAIPLVIKARRSFDPALPNDLALYFALKLAKEKGIGSVMTGDGSDELFAGYSYMVDLDLDDYLPRLACRMQFSSNELGAQLGIEIKQPFLDREFVSFALSIRPELKVRRQGETKYGKWILRKAFETFLPYEVVWQGKRPIEVGSGFAKLRDKIASRISDAEFSRTESVCPVKFITRDHLFYYLVYRQVVGDIPQPEPGQSVCPGCSAIYGRSGGAHPAEQKNEHNAGQDERGDHHRQAGAHPDTGCDGGAGPLA